jgi:hypothetical protein
LLHSASLPLLWVVTAEEQRRAQQEIADLAVAQQKRVWLWSATVGVVNQAVPDREDSSRRDPLLLFRSIVEDKEGGCGFCATFIRFSRIRWWCGGCASWLSCLGQAPRR